MPKEIPDDKKEMHVTVLKPTHDKIVALAKRQRRSYRNVVAILVDEAHEKMLDEEEL